MGTQLPQALRTLCFDTGWTYAVFWKLQHGAPMMLTWEDAYYDSHEQHNPSDNKGLYREVHNFHDGRDSHDSLGLAVAKMSYHVYALGEGIVGQVALTGKHLWIFGDKHVNNSSSSFEYSEGWQTQFSAGIMTIVLVAVHPYGVVQLGSLKKITEDLKLVNHIRDIFFAFQDSSVARFPSLTEYSIESYSCMSDISTRSSFGSSYDCIHNPDKTVSKEKTNVCSPMFPSVGKFGSNSNSVPLACGYPKETVELISKHGGFQILTPMGCESATQPRYGISLTERQRQLQMNVVIDNKGEGKISHFRDIKVVGSEGKDSSSSRNHFNYKTDLDAPAVDNSGADVMYFPSDLLPGSATWESQKGASYMAEPFNLRIQKDLEKNLETEFNDIGRLNKPSNFSAGCELYEVLGPAFSKQNTYCDWEVERTEAEAAIVMPEAMTSSSMLTTESSSEHLLEAVVANVCCRGTDAKSEKSSCTLVQSVLTTENMPTPICDKDPFGSAGYSFDQPLVEDSWQCLNSSDACGVGPAKDLGTSNSTCFEQLERPHRLANMKKRGAKSGENSRPRPRDRQLIQDRIKELRELVPNGSKCNIDSLLESTIKHMLFLQSMTTHAEKLNKCVESKLRDKESGMQRLSNYTQGSSWAMEVGSHQEVSPIVVENINLDGHMLIEMLCEECSHFLEIAEAIRNLGLKILKGVTEAYGKRTRMHFVVEVQNNRSVHRMDILWSLMHVLQLKAIV